MTPCFALRVHLPVPDDKLISGRRVLFRRNAEAKYERGLVTIAVGPSLFITTDSFPMPFFVDANDVLSALVDRIPAPGELKPGVAVIAREPEGELFVQATVVRTEDKDGRLSCLVRFSQGAEDWKPLNDVRVMLLSRPGGIFFPMFISWYTRPMLVISTDNLPSIFDGAR